ncbi:hypothetical protein, partial [Microcoleus sp. D3_18a_C4]|uniref:hypothetical protein n=1 Tax=unclassified Microcoleus TaxID=2642155 RepID=UPI002FD759D7
PSKKDGRDAHPTITIKIVSYLIRDPDSCYIIFGRLTVIPVGAGSPAIVAKNRQAQKPAPTMYDARSIGHDISC